MRDSRTKNTKRNIILSYVETIITLLFQFVSRTIIIHVLGEEYLGLTSLFTSILHVLNMAEMGFSSAVVFNMYRPIAENDTKTICSLLNYYKRIYYRVALVILAICLIILPFLPDLIKGHYPSEYNIYILYILYLFNTVCSYVFFAYKSALLNALQRLDLVKFSYSLVSVVQYSLQIISLLAFRNFYFFVISIIIGTICKNIVTAIISDRFFPQYKCGGDIEPRIKNDLLSRVKGLLICNISATTYTTFDSIILSMFIGLASVAMYNNYLTIISGVTLFVTLIRNAMQASVGNSVATETMEKNYHDMLLWQFLFSVIATVCVTCLLSVLQPFMTLWMGKELLLPMVDVVLLCLWFYFNVIQNSFFLYLGGNGYWWEMRWPYILSTICNIFMNLILGKIFGISGIIFSTLFSSLLFGSIWQCAIVFRKYFNTTMIEFQRRQIFYFSICFISASISYLINCKVTIIGIWGIVVKLLVCIIVSFITQYFSYSHTVVYKEARSLAKRLFCYQRRSKHNN